MADTKISDARLPAAQERINAYHPQPAELAEQPGVEWNDSARLAYLESFAREPGGLLLHAESKTGRRGLGLGENCGNRTLAQAIDGCATHAEKDRFSALAANGKQQVGEVQGDALVTDEMVQTFKAALSRAQLPGKTRTYFLKDSELPSLLREVLADRQPAREPVAYEYTFSGLGKRVSEAHIGPEFKPAAPKNMQLVAVHPLYAAPPGQPGGKE
ncbi:hypothetical protein BRC2024_HCTLARHO_CDS_0105 [Acinetobacter phage vB_AbaS_Silvergun]